MRLLICGDIVGRAAREAVAPQVPRLRRELKLDFVIVNGENAAHGFGITETICAELYAAGVDVITTGNHVWDRREIMTYIAGDRAAAAADQFPARHARQRLRHLWHDARTAQFWSSTPWRGFSWMRSTIPSPRSTGLLDDASARLGRCDHRRFPRRGDLGERPRWVISAMAASRPWSARIATCRPPIIAFSPMARPTSTDLGMCGDYDSVIGMQKEIAVARFVTQAAGRAARSRTR